MTEESDDLMETIRLVETIESAIPCGEPGDRIDVNRRLIATMVAVALRPEIKRLVALEIESLKEEIAIWHSVFPDIAPERVLPKPRRFRHKKRGTTYTVVGRGELQMSFDGLVDGSEMVIYRSDDDGRLWVREAGEFEDGRFEEITDARAALGDDA